MIQRYLRTLSLFLLLFVPFSSQAQVTPFQDYVKCKSGFLRNKRDTLFPAKFDQIREISYNNGTFSSTKAWIVSEKNVYGCLGSNGNWILPLKYEKVSFDVLWSSFLVKENGKLGVLSKTGSVIIPIEYDDIYSETYNNAYYGWVFGRKGNHIGAFNARMEPVIPVKYKTIKRINIEYYWKTANFFQVESDNGFGLYTEDGKEVIPAAYAAIKLFNDPLSKDNKTLFLVTNKNDEQTITGESGELLFPFTRLELYPAYEPKNILQYSGLDYICAMDTNNREQLWNLVSGKRSDFYDHITLVGNKCVASNGKQFIVLDSNFNQLYTYFNPVDVLETFDLRSDLSDRNHYKLLSEKEWIEIADELAKYDRKDDLPILKVHRRTRLSKGKQKKTGNEFEELYGIFNLENGETSPVIYHKILRVGCYKGIYYWGIRKEKGQPKDALIADVYDSSGVFLRTARFSDEEYNQVRNFIENERYVLHEFIPVEKDWKYSGFLMNGVRIADYIFEEVPQFKAMTSDSTGVLAFEATGGSYDRFRLVDFNNKPLLENRSFSYDGNWNVLHDGADANKHNFDVWKIDDDLEIIVDDKCNILLDSCTYTGYVRFNGNVKLDTTKAYLVGHKNEIYYVRAGKTFVPLDAAYFVNPAEVNYISDYVKVDREGRLIYETKPKTFAFGNLVCVQKGTMLTISDKKGKLIEELDNVEAVGRMYDVIFIGTTEQKMGLIDPATGKWFFRPKYNNLNYVLSDRTDVFYAKELSRSDKWMIVKSDGTPITEPVFDFSQGLLPNTWNVVRSFDKYGIIGPDYKFICPPLYDNDLEIEEKRVLFGSSKYALIDKATGKAFEFKHNLVNRSYRNGHLFYFNDSIQFLSFSGEEIIPPTPVSKALSTINLSKVLYLDPGVKMENSRVVGGVTYCADKDSALWMHCNRNLLDEAKRWALDWKQFSWNELQNQKSKITCRTEPIQVTNGIYSEELLGSCYEQPRIKSAKQTYSYKNYSFENGNMRLLQLSDLFLPQSNYLQLIDSRLEKAIQQEQFFGPNCLDLPAIIEEFKRNFYIDGNSIVFVYYPENIHIRIPLKELSEVIKYK